MSVNRSGYYKWKYRQNNPSIKEISRQSDIKLIKEDNKEINDEIASIKENIKYLTGVDVDSFKTLEFINKKIKELESIDNSFINEINEIKETLKNCANTKLEWIIL